MFRLVSAGIVAVWLVLISILVYRHYVSGVELAPLQSLGKEAFQVREEWCGLFGEDGTKVGYLHRTVESIADQYRFIQEVTFFPPSGTQVEPRTNRFRCLTDGQYRVVSFDFESQGEQTFRTHGELQGERLVMFMEKGREHRAANRTVRQRPLLPLSLMAALFQAGLEPGKKLTFPVLDVRSLRVLSCSARWRRRIR